MTRGKVKGVKPAKQDRPHSQLLEFGTANSHTHNPLPENLKASI